MNRPKMLLKLAVAIALIVCTVGFYVPNLIYFSQRTYFTEYFLSLVVQPLLYLSLLGALLLGLLAVFPLKVLKLVTAVTLAFSLFLWLQADLFSVSYGVLDGSQINFEHFTQRGVIELIVLGVIVILALIFNKLFNKHLPFIVGVVLVGQLVITCINVIQEPTDKNPAESMDQEFLNYSSEKNVIVIVLDTFGGEFFQQIIKRNPGFKTNFNGFVSYSDAISNYPATKGSLPSMLTGKMIPKDVKYRRFLSEYVGQSGLPKLMEKAGYTVSVISVYSWFKDFYAKRYMHEPNLNPKDLQLFYGAQLFDYSLFRVLPHHLKASIYNQGQWLFSQRVATQTTVPNTFPERGNLILDMMTEGATLSDASPRFKIIHVTTPHPEFVFDENCEKYNLPANEINGFYMYQQSVCALKKLNALLDKYKALGIYDKSLIVVTSDHGARLLGDKSLTGFPSYFELNTSGIMFMIKGIGQSDQFLQVEQPFSLIKLYETLLDFSEYSSKFDQLIDTNRLFYSFRNNHIGARGYLQDAPLFEVGPNYLNPDSWKLKGFVNNECEAIKLPLSMTFKTGGREQNCAKYGFDYPDPNGLGTWTQGIDSRIIFNLDSTKIDPETNYNMTLEVNPNLHPLQKVIHLTVELNDQQIGTIELSSPGSQVVSFQFNGSIFSAKDEQVIKLLMPNIKAERALKKNGDSRKLGILLSAININTVN